MKIAISIYNGQIAPVFDVAESLLLLAINEEEIIDEVLSLTDMNEFEKIGLLKTNDTNTLICGAISRQLQYMIESNNIQVFPFVTGEVKDVVKAFLDNNLFNERFFMPGYERNRQRRHRGNGEGKGGRHRRGRNRQ